LMVAGERRREGRRIVWHEEGRGKGEGSLQSIPGRWCANITVWGRGEEDTSDDSQPYGKKEEEAAPRGALTKGERGVQPLQKRTHTGNHKWVERKKPSRRRQKKREKKKRIMRKREGKGLKKERKEGNFHPFLK